MTPLNCKRRFRYVQKTISIFLIIAFISSSLSTQALAQASQIKTLNLPSPGVRISLSPEFTPAHLKGLIIHPKDALRFDFIVAKGDEKFTDSQKHDTYQKLIKYFLASLAVPDENQWVNLSPYEKDRIIKDDFGKTEMGRDLLAQDYLLKQITASLIYPEDGIGKKFWDKVYAKAQEQFGTTNVPLNTFNKVWIIPDSASVYEQGNMVYVVNQHLKVMLEQDYLAMQKNQSPTRGHVSQELQNVSPSTLPNELPMHVKAPQGNNQSPSVNSQILKEIIIPELEKEVNEGKNFAMLRQVYSGMILAAWYKRTLKESLLGKIYANQSKVKGVDQDPKNNQAIYQQYLKAFKKGVFNFIKEDQDKYTQKMIPRKYFSGGAVQPNWTKITQPVSKAMAVLSVEESATEIVSAGVNTINDAMAINNAQGKSTEGLSYDEMLAIGEAQAIQTQLVTGNLSISEVRELKGHFYTLMDGYQRKVSDEMRRKLGQLEDALNAVFNNTFDGNNNGIKQGEDLAKKIDFAQNTSLKTIFTREELESAWEEYRENYLAVTTNDPKNMDTKEVWISGYEKLGDGLYRLKRNDWYVTRPFIGPTAMDNAMSQAQTSFTSRVVESMILGNHRRSGKSTYLVLSDLVNFLYNKFLSDDIKGRENAIRTSLEKLEKMSPEQQENLLRMNMPLYHALADGISNITLDPIEGNKSIIETLERIANGEVPDNHPDMVTLAKIAHAAWASGVFYRGLEKGLKKLESPLGGVWDFLPGSEKTKDIVLLRGMAGFLADQMRKALETAYPEAVKQRLEQRITDFLGKNPESRKLRGHLETAMFIHRNDTREDGRPYFDHIMDVVTIRKAAFYAKNEMDIIRVAYHDFREDHFEDFEGVKNYVEQNIATLKEVLKEKESSLEALKLEAVKPGWKLKVDMLHFEIDVLKSKIEQKRRNADELKWSARILSNQFDENKAEYKELLDQYKKEINANPDFWLQEFGVTNDLDGAKKILYYRALQNPLSVWEAYEENKTRYNAEFIRNIQLDKLSDILANSSDLKTASDDKMDKFLTKLKLAIKEFVLESSYLTFADKNTFFTLLSKNINDLLSRRSASSRVEELLELSNKYAQEMKVKDFNNRREETIKVINTNSAIGDKRTAQIVATFHAVNTDDLKTLYTIMEHRGYANVAKIENVRESGNIVSDQRFQELDDLAINIEIALSRRALISSVEDRAMNSSNGNEFWKSPKTATERFLKSRSGLKTIDRTNISSSVMSKIPGIADINHEQWRKENAGFVAAHLNSLHRILDKLVSAKIVSVDESKILRLFIEGHDLGYGIDFNNREYESKLKEVWFRIGKEALKLNENEASNRSDEIYDLLFNYAKADSTFIASEVERLTQKFIQDGNLTTDKAKEEAKKRASAIVSNGKFLVPRVLAHGTTSIILVMQKLIDAGVDKEKAFALALNFASHHLGYPISMASDFVVTGIVKDTLAPLLLLNEPNKKNPDILRLAVARHAGALVGLSEKELADMVLTSALAFALDRTTAGQLEESVNILGLSVTEDEHVLGDLLFGPGELLGKKSGLVVTNVRTLEGLNVSNLFDVMLKNVLKEAQARNDTFDYYAQHNEELRETLMIAKEHFQLITEEQSEAITQLKDQIDILSSPFGLLGKAGFTGKMENVFSDIKIVLNLYKNLNQSKDAFAKTTLAYLAAFLVSIYRNSTAMNHIKEIKEKTGAQTEHYFHIPEIAAIINALGEKTLILKPGAVLIEEGQENKESVFLITKGEVKIYVKNAEGKDVFIAKRGPGEVIGEQSVLKGKPASATVTAEGEVTVVEIPAERFLQAINNNSPFAKAIERASLERIRQEQLVLKKVDEKRADKAMDALGGIDFNALNLNLQIKRDGKGMALPINMQNLEHITIDGLIPTIFNIRPVNSTTLFTQFQPV